MSNESLRKVGFYEDFYLNAFGCTLMTRFYRIKSKLNIFENLDLVEKAIREWKMIHPFRI